MCQYKSSRFNCLSALPEWAGLLFELFFLFSFFEEKISAHASLSCCCCTSSEAALCLADADQVPAFRAEMEDIVLAWAQSWDKAHP